MKPPWPIMMRRIRLAPTAVAAYFNRGKAGNYDEPGPADARPPPGRRADYNEAIRLNAYFNRLKPTGPA